VREQEQERELLRQALLPVRVRRALLEREPQALPPAEAGVAEAALLFAPEHPKPTAIPPAKATSDLPVSSVLVFPRLLATRVTL
jgi:hypothetical protein